jgi:hypothetical protein
VALRLEDVGALGAYGEGRVIDGDIGGTPASVQDILGAHEPLACAPKVGRPSLSGYRRFKAQWRPSLSGEVQSAVGLRLRELKGTPHAPQQ